MRLIRAYLAAATVAAGLVGAQSALACSCMQRSVEQMLEQPGVIFTGKAEAVEQGAEPMRATTRFAVETMWKGEDTGSLTVQHPTEVAAGCGVIFEPGKSYIVAAQMLEGSSVYSTNMCTMLPFLDTANQEATLAVLRAYRDEHGGGAAAPVSFAGAEESGFDWSGRDLAGVSFAGATLKDGVLARSRLEGASFAGASLDNVDLSGANLRNAQFAGASLTAVTLAGARLAGAGFAGATLAKADLRDLDFGTAILSGADLSGADLSGANLGAALLLGVDLSGARHDSRTVWPQGFDPAAAGAVAGQ